ncbi:basic blue protein [Manihot esculenta]|uniref:Phytocyanin domain-containing protein n=1 Tax=Manihot esculenta TaxID=3983 RepID=A0A2C9V5U4_MANES|nr:basic blue protein [Manihot esculenta]OAY39887.1 hypothetical protein MANES_10G131100v8 [Manihot esculenta]
MARGGQILGILVVFPVLLLLNFKTTEAATYVVGGDIGWSPNANVQAWAQKHRFFADDTLVFNYDSELYDVVVVDQGKYEKCTYSPDDLLLDTGNDKIQLTSGPNYFITSDKAVCQKGMKLAVNASPPPRRKLSLH